MKTNYSLIFTISTFKTFSPIYIKGFSIIIILILLMGYATPILAQEEGAEENSEQIIKENQNEVQSEETLKDINSETSEEGQATSDDNQTENIETLSVSSTDDEPSVNTRQQHLTSNSPEVSEMNGSLNYSYPLLFPNGKHGLTPSISLQYNSTNRDLQTILSRGWSINIPKIERINKTGTNNLYITNHFQSSIDGELIDQGNGIYTPRIENGSFNKYELQNDTWIVTDKAGTQYIFGETAQARDNNPNDTLQVHCWMLERIQDILGTTINYSYFKESGQIYPSNISYNQEGDFIIQFHRETKPKMIIPWYHKSYETRTQQRITYIDVIAMGELISQYDLVYDANQNLHEISLTGFEDGDSLSFPPTVFDYTVPSDTPIWETVPSMTMPIGSGGIYNVNPLKITDVDGDGLPDFVSMSHGTQSSSLTYTRVYLQEGGTWQYDSGYSSFNAGYSFTFYCYCGYGNTGPRGSFLLDINNDGLPDIHSHSGYAARYNNGITWDELFQPPQGVTSNGYQYPEYGDINGDGTTDFFYGYSQSNNIHHKAVVAKPDDSPEGYDWELASSGTSGSFMVPEIYGVISSASANRLIDLNGDGLSDFWHNVDNQYIHPYLLMNTGFGWDASGSNDYFTQSPLSEYVMNYLPASYLKHVRFIDLNDDGLLDIVNRHGYGTNTFMATDQSTWSQIYPVYPNSFIFQGDIPNVPSPSVSPDAIIDMNGDGLPDIVDSNAGFMNVHLNIGSRNRLHKITSPLGATMEIEYTFNAEMDSSNRPRMAIQPVKKITTDSGAGAISEVTYEYFGADFYFNTPFDKRFAGFASITKTDKLGRITTTKFHQNNGEEGNESVDNEYALIGKPYEITIQDTTGNILSRNRFNYIITDLVNTAQSVQIESTLSQSFEDGASIDMASELEYDQYGSTTKEIQYGLVNGNNNGTFIDIEADSRTTEYTYTNDTLNYIIGLPKKIELKDHNGNRVAKTNTNYYSNGQVKDVNTWIEGSTHARIRYEYHPDWTLKKMRDPLGYVTQYNWDVTGRHIEQIIYPNTLHDYFTYDPKRGLLIEERQNNGMHKTYDYDPLGRLIRIKQAIASTTLQTTHEYSYDTTTFPQSMTEIRHRTWNESDDVIIYYDGFGRVIQTKTERLNGWQTISTKYDNLGRVESYTMPYHSSVSEFTTTLPAIEYFVINTYDAKDRPLNTTNSLGVTSFTYGIDSSNFVTTSTNALGNDMEHHTDVFGNLTKVVENNDGNQYFTHYEYTITNLLKKLIDAEGNEREWEYDGLGRITRAEDLHRPTNATPPSYMYEYDKRDLIKTTLPDGVQVGYEYDPVGNLLRETNLNNPSETIEYTYGGCNRGRGRLCRIETPDMKKRFHYRFDGLPSRENVTIDGQDFLTVTEYNRAGHVKKVTHPNGDIVTTKTTHGGLPQLVSYNDTPFAAAIYDINDQLYELAHNNGIISTFTYDPSKGFLPISKTTRYGLYFLQNFTYDYDSLGQMTQLSESGTSMAAKYQAFQYDDIGRLLRVNTSNTVNNDDYIRTYGYSPTGNILLFNGENYSYNTTHPQAVSQIGSTSFIYDDIGNLISDGTQTHTWNYKGLLTSSTNGTNISSYSYDNHKGRIKLIENGNVTVYPTASYEEKNGVPKLSISLGSIFVSTIDNGEVSHIHTDHLGGTHLTTDASGNFSQELDYYPFGETRVIAGANVETRQFTGYIKDTGTGLNYAQARYYQSNIGKFISQDPVAQFSPQQVMFDPQQLNHYSYARNNPVKYIDPNGEDAKDVLIGVGDAYVEAVDNTLEWIAAQYHHTLSPFSQRSADWMSSHSDQWIDEIQENSAQLEAIVSDPEGYAQEAVSSISNMSESDLHYVLGTVVFGMLEPGFSGEIKTAKTITSISNLPIDVQKNIARFNAKIPSNAKGSTLITQLENGSYQVSAVSPGKVEGSYAIYQKTISSNGITTAYTKSTFDASGNIIHTKNKL